MNWLEFDNILVKYSKSCKRVPTIIAYMLCIPMILFTLAGMVPWCDFTVYLYFWNISIAYIYVALIGLYYFLLDPYATVLFLPISIVLVMSFRHIINTYLYDNLETLIRMHLYAWGILVGSHLIFEIGIVKIISEILFFVMVSPIYIHIRLMMMLGYRPALYAKIYQKLQDKKRTNDD